jgi:AraC-like DNA-binding protein
MSLSGQMEFRPVSAPFTFVSEMGSRGILVLLPQGKLRIKRRHSWACQSDPSRQINLLSLNSEDGFLSARLLRDCLAVMATQLANGCDPRQIERRGDLIAALLKEAIGERLPLDKPASNGSVPWYIAAAERQLLDDVSQQISVMDLAQIAGVSTRTLHDGFRKHRGASPMKMLRAQRMEMVRKDLTKPEESTSVTDAAMKWGFNHLGRFSSYYIERFGERPSETLRLARMRRTKVPKALTASAS